MSCLSDRRILEKINEWLHVRRVQRWEIANCDRPVFSQHSRGDANRVSVTPFLLDWRLGKDFIPTANQTSLFGRVGRRPIACGIDEKLALSATRHAMAQGKVVGVAFTDGD